MTYRLSPLNGAAAFSLLGLLIFALYKFPDFNDQLLLASLLGFGFIAILALLVDFLLQLLLRNRWLLIRIEWVIVVVFSIRLVLAVL